MSKNKELDEFEFQLRAQQEYAEGFKQPQDGQQQASEQSQAAFVDPNDGTVYEWDSEKRAWFPKVYITAPFACLFVCTLFVYVFGFVYTCR